MPLRSRIDRLRGPVAAAVLTCAGILAFAAPVHAQRPVDVPPPPADAEGLERRASSRVDEFYLRPGADFTAYRRVLLSPVEVSFGKYWARNHRDVDAKTSSRLRVDLAKDARTEFARQLNRAGGYPVVSEPGADVLEVKASLVNLDIHAPDANNPAVTRSYVLSAGEATLVAELRDSLTGTLLARIVDRREMREYPEFTIANSVTNSGEARELVGLWSRLLRRYLDTARADGKGS